MSYDSIMLILLPLLGSVMLAYGVAQAAFDLRRSQRKVVMERLKNSRNNQSASQISDDIRKQGPQFKGAMAAALNKFQYTEQLQRTLEQANLNWSAAQVLVNLSATAVCIAALMVVFGISILIAAGLAVAVFFLPLMYFSKKRKWRMNKLVEQLPDVFELLSQALKAGHSLASGMQLISTQVPEPAGTEFGRVFHEQNLGLKIEHALKNMANRVDMLDVRFFVTAVLIQRQTGGDLS
jgi:tight adherence protein B